MFKQALNFCVANRSEEISKSVEEKYKNKDMTQFWKEVRLKQCRSKKAGIIDGKTNDEDILDIFTNKFLPDDSSSVNNDEKLLLERIKSIWSSKKKFYPKISLVTLRNLIKKLSNGAGQDGIHSVFLKQASDDFLENVAHFINSCYCHFIFPSNLLKGDINPTIKDLKGNSTDSSNYRPVMQSSCLLKIIELHLLSILDEMIFFNFRQYGFRKGCSTTDACWVLKETIHKYMRKKGMAYVNFIDLSKAFDKVDHFLLGQQLLDRNLPPDIVLIVMQYLRNQSARVCWNKMYSTEKPVNKGVRQGGILSPFLFKLYIDDLITRISSKDIGCRLGFLRMNIIAYADDLALLADSRENLSQLYNILRSGLENLRLTLNKNKSVCMFFNSSPSNINEVKLGEDTLSVVENCRYLGHYVSYNFSDAVDVNFRLSTFYSKFNSVFRNFSGVSLTTLIFLFNSYCLPDYGLSVWHIKELINKQAFKSFEVGYSNALKKIVGAPRYSSSHVTADICNQLLLKHHIALLQVRYIKKCMYSDCEVFKLCHSYLKQGYLHESVASYFKDVYSVDIYENDLEILKSRVIWVQKHEYRRGICPFYNQ